MKTIDIKGSVREGLGKKATQQLRSEGLVPCVLYGNGEVVHFQVPERDFRDLVYTPNVFIVNLDIDGNQCQALVQDTQFHPVEEQIIHMDFKIIAADKPVKTVIPVKTIGFAKGVQAGGRLSTIIRRLKVKALVENLPDYLEIDVTSLNVGDGKKVKDIDVEGITLLDPKDAMVVSVAATRATRAADAAAATDTKAKKK